VWPRAKAATPFFLHPPSAKRAIVRDRSGDMKKSSLGNLLREVHHNEEGTVSLETILIIGAIALPVLIVLIMFGWPKIRDYFKSNVEELQTDANNAKGTY
jgi:hypothetical protein